MQQFHLDFEARVPPAVQARIHDGMKAADDHADEKWKHIFDACVLAVARRQPELTAADVREEFEKLNHPPDTHNLSAIGPALKRAQRMGIIKGTLAMRMSNVESTHGRKLTVWESKYYEGAERMEVEEAC